MVNSQERNGAPTTKKSGRFRRMVSAVTRFKNTTEHTRRPEPSISSPESSSQNRDRDLNPNNNAQLEVPAARPVNTSDENGLIDGSSNEPSPAIQPLHETHVNNGVGYPVPKSGERGGTTALRASISQPLRSNESLSHVSGISAIKALSEDISTILDNNEIGLLNVRKPHFPDSEYKMLFTRERIETVMPDASSELIRFVREKAKRLFAITVLSNQTELVHAMTAFYHHSVTDANCLPIEKKLTAHGECDRFMDGSECSTMCRDNGRGNCKHKEELDVFHHKSWDRTSFSRFYEKQWSFFLPPFRHGTFRYDLHSDCALPFEPTIKMDGRIGPGHFSDVTPASMLAAYQDTIDSRGRDTVNVAIKTLRPLEGDKGYNVVDEWTSESNAHKTLDQLHNDHIIRGLAAYSQHGRYHIILEWADGGSLRSFWKEHPKPQLSKETIMELLRQLYGLADALASMHHTSNPSPRSDSGGRKSSASSAGIQVQDFQHIANSKPNVPKIPVVVPNDEAFRRQEPSPPPIIIMDDPASSGDPFDDLIIRPLSRQSTRIGENWRHGDIKPDNILRFESDRTWLGTLKLADLGRSKQRYLATRELPDKEIDRWRTKPYEAPDIWISQGEASMSRLYDCWAMGCVFFEAIVWMLYGQQAIWNFDETTDKANKEGTPYWSRIGDSDAEVSALVRGWMNYILEKDPECNTMAGTVMGDLMKLVKRKLFKIHLPPNSDIYTEGFRTNAEDMRQDLWAMLVRAEAEEKGETDDGYIFTGTDRSKVCPPSIDADFTAAQEQIFSQNLLVPPLGRQRNSLAVPIPKMGAGRGSLTTRRHNQYTHALNDVWRYVDDDLFAISVLQRNKFPFSNLFSDAAPTICASCMAVGRQFAHFTFDRNMQDLRKALTTKSCELCSLLYCAARNAKIAGTATVSFSTSPAGVRINDNDQSDLVLRFCRAWDLDGITDSAAYPPIGLPRLPNAGTTQHVNILRAWLKDCDELHECVRVQSSRYCPKRLLAVGSEVVLPQLIETSQLTEKEREDIRYVALSHPWGDPARHEHFRTTTETLPDYLDSVIWDDLPQTFKDALKITRDLNIKYIWIDSICIHQGDDGDFNEQAPFMQDIFGSAYCVLAASSADGMTSGFLKDSEAKAVAIPAQFGPTKDKLFVCQTVDNFQRDVLESFLNKRGWVFQERALARRTIFFSKNQTYFECANGVRCETFSKLENSEEAFLGDSDFPKYVKQEKNKGAQQYLFESLYRKYSRLGFSEQTDKPIAISGLEQRLLKVFEDRGGAGIFEKHWGRCLLWKRASKQSPLERIQFQPPLSGDTCNSASTKPKSRYKFRPPPSWSWMSYKGSIDYVQPPPAGVDWNLKGVKLRYTGDSKTSWFSAAENMCMEAEARDFCIGNDTHADETKLTYDDEAWEGRANKKCIIVGSMKTTTVHYVIIVSPNASSQTGVYERIGVGYLPGKYISGVGKKGDFIKVE